MEVIDRPRVIMQGVYPVTVTTVGIGLKYLNVGQVLGMKNLSQNLRLTQFRSITKLNLGKYLK